MPFILAAAVVSLVLLCGFAVAAHATGGDGTGVPALRITAPNGARSVLIGTLHAAAEGLRQPAPGLFDGAKRFVVEGVPSGALPPPEKAPDVLSGQASRARWASFLTAAQLAELHRRAACLEAAEGYPMFSVGALVNSSLTDASARRLAGVAIYRCAPAGLRSRDWLLAQAAYTHGLTETQLEMQHEVQRQREALPEAVYVAQLYDALSPESETVQRDAIKALNAGDYEALRRIVRDAARTPEFAQSVEDIMVTQRNRNWMPRLTDLLDQGDAVVAVGAYHLPGPQGLVALLEAVGYLVTPIQVMAAP